MTNRVNGVVMPSDERPTTLRVSIQKQNIVVAESIVVEINKSRTVCNLLLVRFVLVMAKLDRREVVLPFDYGKNVKLRDNRSEGTNLVIRKWNDFFDNHDRSAGIALTNESTDQFHRHDIVAVSSATCRFGVDDDNKIGLIHKDLVWPRRGRTTHGTMRESY